MVELPRDAGSAWAAGFAIRRGAVVVGETNSVYSALVVMSASIRTLQRSSECSEVEPSHRSTKLAKMA